MTITEDIRATIEDDEIIDLLQDGTIVKVVLALGSFFLIAYLVAVNRPIPSELWGIFTLILGGYFGAQIERARNGRNS